MKFLVSIVMSVVTIGVFAQRTGIGTTEPQESSILHLESADKALLLPRVADVSAVAVPVNGMIVYDKSVECFRGYQENQWSNCLFPHPDAVFSSINCETGSEGTLTIGQMVTGVTQTVTVEVAISGMYTFEATANGVLFSAHIFLPEGTQQVVLTATGVPVLPGNHTFVLNTTPPCSFVRPVQGCGAYIAPGEWKEFMCHNLGADASVYPLIPSWRLIGNYYQWGRNTNILSGNPRYGAAGPSGSGAGQDNGAAVANWCHLCVPGSTAWQDGVKTVNDPCPAGFRVPTRVQWEGVVANNPVTVVGTWTASPVNYSSGKKFGNLLFLPAAGYRSPVDGSIGQRGEQGDYWSSTFSTYDDGTYRHLYQFGQTWNTPAQSFRAYFGASVRCIAE